MESTDASAEGDESKRPAWGLRISLRGLLLLVLCLAVWMGWRVNLARQQREAVALIRANGGSIRYDWQVKGDKPIPNATPREPAWLRKCIGDEFFQDVVDVNFFGDVTRWAKPGEGPTNDDALRALTALPALRQLQISDFRVADTSMEIIGKLSRLESLWVRNASVTDSGMAHVRGLRRLRFIHLTDSALGDETLRYLGEMPALEEISMQQNSFTDTGLGYLRNTPKLKQLSIDFGPFRITDEGMAHLKKVKTLEVLYLQLTAVTDKGLRELRDLPNLKSIHATGSRITDQAAQEFEAERPSVKIFR